MKKLLAIISLSLTLLFPLSAFAALSFQSSLTQSVDGTSFNVGTGSNRVLYVGGLCRSGGDFTSMKYAGVAMTKVNTISSNNVSTGDVLSLWVLVNPTTSGNAIQSAGCTGTVRVSALALNGGDQTTGYNSAATNTGDFGSSAAHSLSVTTQYTNSWIVGYVPNSSGTPTADSNTTFPDANNYVMAYTPTAQTAGSHEIGYTNANTGSFMIAESIANGATKASNFTPWQFTDF